MTGVRRSGRVSKDVPILLMGTDSTGRVFSETTHTVVLSRHGAGVVSSHIFAPEEILTLRFPGSNREADVRLVGRMGSSPEGFIYGIEFVNQEINYWGLDFPPPENYVEMSRGIGLECSVCHCQKIFQQSEVEADIFLTAGNVFHSCEQCGQTTVWRKAKSVPRETPRMPNSVAASTSATAAFTSAVGTSLAPSRSNNLPSSIGTAVLEENRPVARGTQRSVAQKREQNRRKHVRTGVSFLACVRFPGLGDDFVQCENISKGGLCFRSGKRYPEEALIQVAAPYEPGMPTMFTFGQIKRIESLSESGLFRYGVAFTGA